MVSTCIFVKEEFSKKRFVSFFWSRTTYLCMRRLSPNVSTTPLRQWGFRQVLPLSWAPLRGKHCQHPIAIMGVVDTFREVTIRKDVSSWFLPRQCTAVACLAVVTLIKDC